MREVHAAIERFDMAIARLESALDSRDSQAAPAASSSPEDTSGLIERLRRENEALRAARSREAELRGAALRRVDVAIAALEAALSSQAGGAAKGRSKAIFGDLSGAATAADGDKPAATKREAKTRDAMQREKPARQGRAAAG